MGKHWGMHVDHKFKTIQSVSLTCNKSFKATALTISQVCTPHTRRLYNLKENIKGKKKMKFKYLSFANCLTYGYKILEAVTIL